MDYLGVLSPFQQYFSRIGTIEGWTWKALCNEAPFRFGKVLASSWIRTCDPMSELSRQPNTSCQKVYLHVTFLKLILVTFFQYILLQGMVFVPWQRGVV